MLPKPVTFDAATLVAAQRRSQEPTPAAEEKPAVPAPFTPPAPAPAYISIKP